jgi:hypothetical protein
VTTFPVTTWWLVGDLSTVPVSDDPDYFLRPFDIPPGAERTAGLGSTVLTAIALLVLAWATRGRLLDPRWWGALIPLLAAGAIAGSGWRVLTAGGIGANIGAGFVVYFGGPVVTALLVWSVAYSFHMALRRLRHRSTLVDKGPTAREE